MDSFSAELVEHTVGLVRLAVGCALVLARARRLAPRLGSGRASTAENALSVGLLSAWLVVALVALLGAAGVLSARALLLGSAGTCVLSLCVRPTPPPALLPESAVRLRVYRWPLLFALLIVLWDLGLRLPAPPTDWDALTYHLYLPARWLQAGRLFHIPTVFGDPAAAFAPQNGALLFTWWMGLLGGDALTNVVNVLAAAGLVLALFRLALLCGASRETSALVAVAVLWIGPLRRAIYEARVDVPMLSFWAASLLFVARGLVAPGSAPWLACGLASGLALGTKVVGLTLVGPQVLGVAIALLVRRRLGSLFGFVLAVLAGGGWWYVRNLSLYQNPLFPLDLKLAGLRLFPGAIPFGAVAGMFHYEAAGLPSVLLSDYGWATFALTAIGWAALLASLLRRDHQRRVRVLAAAVSVYWAGFYFLLLPHNTETRFFLPVVCLALLGCAELLERLRRRSRVAARIVWALVLLLLCFEFELSKSWRLYLPGPAEAGVPLGLWIPLGLATAGAFVTATVSRTPVYRRGALVLAVLGLLACVGIAQETAMKSRQLYHASGRYQGWAPAIRALDEVEPAARDRVAYAGFNLPHTLMGARFTREVRYVNVQGGIDDGSFEFWQRNPQLARRQKPALYRGRGDVETWLQNLRSSRAEWLLVFRLHPQERYIRFDTRGFPIERTWARANPDRFELVTAGATFELFRVLTADSEPAPP